MEDLKGVHPGVTVYVSALQKPNPAQISWLMYFHHSFDLNWFMSLCNNLLVLLHAST
jgi:hypothetical protein